MKRDYMTFVDFNGSNVSMTKSKSKIIFPLLI